jgi:hypothetical protein
LSSPALSPCSQAALDEKRKRENLEMKARLSNAGSFFSSGKAAAAMAQKQAEAKQALQVRVATRGGKVSGGGGVI